MKQRWLLIVGLVCLVAATAPLAGGKKTIEFLNSGKVLPTDMPFSEAVRAGDTLYLSGMVGVVPGSLKLAEGGVEAETKQTMDNIRTVLGTHGYAMTDVVKCTVMLADIGDWPAFNEVYRTYFDERYPARSAFGANGLALGATVEVECIAVKGK